MNISLGSLLTEDLQALEELNLLPEDIKLEGVDDTDEELTMSGGLGHGDSSAVAAPAQQQEDQSMKLTQRSGKAGGVSWFEEMLDGSRLGRTQNTRRGVGVSTDGSTRVEWEISEYFDDGSEAPHTPTGSKRKISEVAKDDDVSMHQ